MSHDVSVNVINEGNDLLIIEKIYSSCKCLNGKMKRKTVFPFEQAQLLITVDPASVNPKEQYFIMLQTNDPLESLKRVRVQVDQKSSLQNKNLVVFPEIIKMMPVQKGGYSGRVMVKNESGGEISFCLEGALQALGLSRETYFLHSGEKKLLELTSEVNLHSNDQKPFLILVSGDLNIKKNLPVVWEDK